MKLLKHPNILPLYAAFLDDDQLWMVMPYVSGGSASDIMRRNNPTVRLFSVKFYVFDIEGVWLVWLVMPYLLLALRHHTP